VSMIFLKKVVSLANGQEINGDLKTLSEFQSVQSHPISRMRTKDFVHSFDFHFNDLLFDLWEFLFSNHIVELESPS
jgi:hypothetical protein